MESMCVVCNENVMVEDYIKTECGHEFHTHCIAKWIIKNDNCPMCRHKNPCGWKTYYYTFMYYFNNDKLKRKDKKRYNKFNTYIVSRYVDTRVYKLNVDERANIPQVFYSSNENTNQFVRAIMQPINEPIPESLQEVIHFLYRMMQQ